MYMCLLAKRIRPQSNYSRHRQVSQKKRQVRRDKLTFVYGIGSIPHPFSRPELLQSSKLRVRIYGCRPAIRETSPVTYFLAGQIVKMRTFRCRQIHTWRRYRPPQNGYSVERQQFALINHCILSQCKSQFRSVALRTAQQNAGSSCLLAYPIVTASEQRSRTVSCGAGMSSCLHVDAVSRRYFRSS